MDIKLIRPFKKDGTWRRAKVLKGFKEVRDLREIQLRETEILRKFAKFCDDHDLIYYIACGTLIGALRHKGFIPWDNDIDTWMPRLHYEKLIELHEEFFKETGYEINSYKCKKDCYNTFMRIDEPNTETSMYYPTDPHLGIFIDVFPMDKLHPNYYQREEWLRASRILLKEHKIKVCWREYNWKWILNHIKELWKMRNLSWYDMTKKYDDFCRMYEDMESDRWGVICTERSYMDANYPWDAYGTERFAEFEGTMFRIPERAEDMLAEVYGGDWMIPPVRDNWEQKVAPQYTKDKSEYAFWYHEDVFYEVPNKTENRFV